MIDVLLEGSGINETVAGLRVDLPVGSRTQARGLRVDVHASRTHVTCLDCILQG